jgi:hypothetical protein
MSLASQSGQAVACRSLAFQSGRTLTRCFGVRLVRDFAAFSAKILFIMADSNNKIVDLYILGVIFCVVRERNSQL